MRRRVPTAHYPTPKCASPHLSISVYVNPDDVYYTYSGMPALGRQMSVRDSNRLHLPGIGIGTASFEGSWCVRSVVRDVFCLSFELITSEPSVRERSRGMIRSRRSEKQIPGRVSGIGLFGPAKADRGRWRGGFLFVSVCKSCLWKWEKGSFETTEATCTLRWTVGGF